MDIFLPICGEPVEVLRNTWIGVFELIQAYPGQAHAYVLDDGLSDEAMALAPSFGFSYVRRPNQREHKKAGNLNYAFRRTRGNHIVIFDADFRPRADFLAETLPYLDDPIVGIVQTPQFFRVNTRQAWVERAAEPDAGSFLQGSSGVTGSVWFGTLRRLQRCLPKGWVGTPRRVHRDSICRGLAHRPRYALLRLPAYLCARPPGGCGSVPPRLTRLCVNSTDGAAERPH